MEESIKNSSRLSLEALEKKRKELGVTQRYLSAAIGLEYNAWGSWVRGKEHVPSRYKSRVVEVFVALGRLKDGQRLLPVSKQNGDDDPKTRLLRDIPEVLDIIWSHIQPVIKNSIISRSADQMIKSLKSEIKEVL